MAQNEAVSTLTVGLAGVAFVTSKHGDATVSTTSLKLPEDLKKRVMAAAQGRGMSTHAFMVQAIEASAKASELRASFVAQADKARKAALRTGKGYEAEVVHEYLRARIMGRPGARPKSVAWRG